MIAWAIEAEIYSLIPDDSLPVKSASKS
jgi:hypothetical protein